MREPTRRSTKHSPRPGAPLMALAAALLLVAACAKGTSDTGNRDDDDDGGGGQPAVGAGGSGGGMGGAGGNTASSSSGTGGVGGPRTPVPGDLVISEFMPNPDLVMDEDGEWLELANVSGDILQLEGCRLYDLNTTPDEVFFGAGTLVDPGTRVVAARSSQSTLNGGIDGVVLAYSTSYTLANESDEIILECVTGIIDQITYDGSWPFTAGTAAQLRANSLNAQANDSASNWCAATNSYGMGDLGSPGLETACP